MQNAKRASTTRDFRLFLQDELLKRCEKNSSYSLRSFAKSLQTSHAALSQILNRKRSLTEKTIEKLGRALDLEPSRIQDFKNFHVVFNDSTTRQKNNERKEIEQLTEDSFRVISDWYHLAMIELSTLESFNPDAKWISRVLGISVNEVNFAIERLQRLGMIEISADGQWENQTPEFTQTTNVFESSSARKKWLRQVFEKSLSAIDDFDYSQRSHSGVTMSMSANKIQTAKELIKNFRTQFMLEMQGEDDASEVFQLCVSLFPISQIFKEKNNRENENE